MALTKQQSTFDNPGLFIDLLTKQSYHMYCIFNPYHIVCYSRYGKHMLKCHKHALRGEYGKVCQENAKKWLQCQANPSHFVHESIISFHEKTCLIPKNYVYICKQLSEKPKKHNRFANKR